MDKVKVIYETAITCNGDVEINEYHVRSTEHGKIPNDDDILYYLEEREMKANCKHNVHSFDFYQIIYDYSGFPHPNRGYTAFFLSDKLENPELLDKMINELREHAQNKLERYQTLKSGLDKLNNSALPNIIYIYWDSVVKPCDVFNPLPYTKVLEAIAEGKAIIDTYCTHFFNFHMLDKGYDVAVVSSNGTGVFLSKLLSNKHNYTNRHITTSHNVEKLLLAGEFTFQKWF